MKTPKNDAAAPTVSIQTFLSTSPEGLAAEQERQLAAYATNKIRQLATHIEAGSYQAALEMLDSSPAGDEMGCDNRYLSFSELELNVDQHGCNMTDVGDVIDRLARLRMMQKVKP